MSGWGGSDQADIGSIVVGVLPSVGIERPPHRFIGIAAVATALLDGAIILESVAVCASTSKSRGVMA